MQAAFLMGGLFPPPAALPLVLPRQDCPGAGGAADADKPAFVKLIVGYVKHADIVPNLLRCPVGQGIELDQLPLCSGIAFVDLHHRNMGAGAGALVSPLSGDPSIQACQLALEGSDLANTAALLVAVLIKAEQALFFHEIFYRGALREQHLQVQVVMLANLIDKAIGFLMQAARVQGEYLDRKSVV